MTQARTVTLADFILARIAEDEAVAQAAADTQGGSWRDGKGIVSSDTEPGPTVPGHSLGNYAPVGRWNLWDCEGARSLGVHEATSAHMARHDPVRVLAECEAKRRIIELHQDGNAELRWDGDPDPLPGYCTVCHDRDMHDQEAWPCHTLELLALPYIGHPDLRFELRP